MSHHLTPLALLLIASCTVEVDSLGGEPYEPPGLLAARMPPVDSVDDLLAHQVPVRALTRVRASATNYLTTTSSAEARLFPERSPMYYVPAGGADGRGPLYRLIAGEHMDGTIDGEGGYATEGVLGFPWTLAAAPPGAIGLLRGYNHANGDHALVGFGSIPPWGEGDWVVEALGGEAGALGYGRRPRGSIACVSGAGIDLCSDMGAGGSVVHLSWFGTQFVDSLDFGREIQSSLNVHSALPTEGGDQLGPPHDPDAALWHGAPVVHHVTDPATRTQETLAVPMEWLHTCFSRGTVEPGLTDPATPCGGDVDTAVLYPDWRLGKIATVAPDDLPLAPETRAHLVRYATVLDTPSLLTASHLEIPTAYVREEFSRLFTVDATNPDLNSALTELPAVLANVFPGGSTTQTDLTAGGVIAANADLSRAIGIYADARALPGLYLTSWRFAGVNKLSAAIYGDLPQGRTTYTTYLVVGSLDHVRVVMRQLYEADVRGGVGR